MSWRKCPHAWSASAVPRPRKFTSWPALILISTRRVNSETCCSTSSTCPTGEIWQGKDHLYSCGCARDFGAHSRSASAGAGVSPALEAQVHLCGCSPCVAELVYPAAAHDL